MTTRIGRVEAAGDSVEFFAHKGLAVDIIQDSDGFNPREDMENEAKIWMFPWSHYCGDEGAAFTKYPDEYAHTFAGLVEYMEKQDGEKFLALPISMGRDGEATPGEPGSTEPVRRFDGMIYISVNVALANWGVKLTDDVRDERGQMVKPGKWKSYKVLTARARDSFLEGMRGSLKTYSDYNTGNVHGYVVSDPMTGEQIDSCWGFFPSHEPGEVNDWDYCKQEAINVADYYAKERATKREKTGAVLARVKTFWNVPQPAY